MDYFNDVLTAFLGLERVSGVAVYAGSESRFRQKYLKRDLLCKNHFYKVFEHSCVAAVCENNQPVKLHPLIFYNPNKS